MLVIKVHIDRAGKCLKHSIVAGSGFVPEKAVSPYGTGSVPTAYQDEIFNRWVRVDNERGDSENVDAQDLIDRFLHFPPNLQCSSESFKRSLEGALAVCEL